MKSGFEKYIPLFTLSLVFIPICLTGQREIKKNPHVKYEVRQTDNSYLIEYTFLNPFDQPETFLLHFPADETRQMIEVFGIPANMFNLYAKTTENLAARQQQLKKGLFLLRDRLIEVDKNAVVEYYSDTFCKPIAELIFEALVKYGRDSRQNRIDFAMRFVQDIPYGIPKYNDKTRHYGGVFPPPKILVEGFGDCDSKAILFAGILRYLIDPEDFIFLNQSDHVLSAIRGTPEKGMTYVRYGSDTFLVAETAGPGRRQLGEKGQYYQSRNLAEPLNVEHRDIFPLNVSETKTFDLAEIKTTSDPTITLKNASDRSLRIQLSTDNVKWKQVIIAPNQITRVGFEKDEKILLRFREDSSNIRTVEVETGNNISFSYNQRRGKWSFSPM